MEAVYYAARANLQRKLSPTSGLDAPAIGPGDGHVGQLDRVTGKNASCMHPKTMSRCCTVSRGHLIRKVESPLRLSGHPLAPCGEIIPLRGR